MIALNSSGRAPVAATVERLRSEGATNPPQPVLSRFLGVDLIGAQEKINGFLANRLDIDTSRIVNVMDRVAASTTSGIESVASRVARVESPVATSVINALGALNQPIATVSVQIADKIVAGTKQIEARVSGAEEASRFAR